MRTLHYVIVFLLFSIFPEIKSEIFEEHENMNRKRLININLFNIYNIYIYIYIFLGYSYIIMMNPI